MTLAPKGDAKYRDQVWAGLIHDEAVLEEERQRRAAAPAASPSRDRRVARPAPRWIPIGGQR